MLTPSFATVEALSNVGRVRFGSEADMCSAKVPVRFAPIMAAKADMPAQ